MAAARVGHGPETPHACASWGPDHEKNPLRGSRVWVGHAWVCPERDARPAAGWEGGGGRASPRPQTRVSHTRVAAVTRGAGRRWEQTRLDLIAVSRRSRPRWPGLAHARGRGHAWRGRGGPCSHARAPAGAGGARGPGRRGARVGPASVSERTPGSGVGECLHVTWAGTRVGEPEGAGPGHGRACWGGACPRPRVSHVCLLALGRPGPRAPPAPPTRVRATRRRPRPAAPGTCSRSSA